MKTNPSTKPASFSHAFTLLELMIVIGIICLLAAVAFPSLAKARNTSRLTRLVSHLKVTNDAFVQYAADNYDVPRVSTLQYQIPPGLNNYLPKNTTWKSGADGYWYYVYKSDLPGYRAYIFLYDTSMTEADCQFLDNKLDNGNISTGAIYYSRGYGVCYGIE